MARYGILPSIANEIVAAYARTMGSPLNEKAASFFSLSLLSETTSILLIAFLMTHFLQSFVHLGIMMCGFSANAFDFSKSPFSKVFGVALAPLNRIRRPMMPPNEMRMINTFSRDYEFSSKPKGVKVTELSTAYAL